MQKTLHASACFLVKIVFAAALGLLCACLLLALPLHAALVFEPAAPWVASGGEIRLSVSGAVEPVTWSATLGLIDGQTRGTGLSVAYTTPSGMDTGIDFIAVLDGAGNPGTVTVLIQPAGDIAAARSPQNAQWEVYTARGDIGALTLSGDGQTLWVGSKGGVEKRDAAGGRLLRLYTRLDGLPSNDIVSLLSDVGGGLWAGTRRDGLARLSADGSWTVYNKDNSGLPGNDIWALLGDGTGGVWIATGNASGLAHLTADGIWTVYDESNSDLPSNFVVRCLLDDRAGGLWIGTSGGGLARLAADGIWTVYDESNSELPDDDVWAVQHDGEGGLWIGTAPLWDNTAQDYLGSGLAHLAVHGTWTVYSVAGGAIRSLLLDDAGSLWLGIAPITRTGTGGGLARLDADGTWTVYQAYNSGLPDNTIQELLDDGAGGRWVGTTRGLARLAADNTWSVHSEKELPGNEVQDLLSDGEGGLWVGTDFNGMAHRDANGTWTVYDTGNSELPDNSVVSFLLDDAGGLWAGTGRGGLARLAADSTWTVYDWSNSDLPHDHVSDLLADGAGGLWVGTRNGLARLAADGGWTVYDTDNSGLPHSEIYCLLDDAAGGLWVCTNGGLARFDADGAWTVYDTSNSRLPVDSIKTLLADGTGGLWVGAWKSLAHLGADGTWTVYDSDNSGLPDSRVTSLSRDGAGGLWVGISEGLAHFGANGSWTVYDTDNSGLPYKSVPSLLADGVDGLWVGTGSGLARLGFGQKNRLVRSLGDTEVLTQNSAAILLLAPGRGYNDNVSLEFMAAHAYRSLQSRGYDHDEIYFLAYKPDLDIDGDGIADRNAVDAPVTFGEFRAGTPRRNLSVQDVRAAFAWSESKGKLDQPLLVAYFGHGDPGELLLDAANTRLGALELKDLLDGYEQATGNRTTVVLEACHSGTLLPVLRKPGRLLLTSADDKRAYFDNFGQLSFSRLLFDRLRRKPKADTFFAAYRHVKNTLPGWGTPFDGSAANNPPQNPLLDDDGDGEYTLKDGTLADSLCLNGCFEYLAGETTELALESLTLPQSVNPGQSLLLQVRISGGAPRAPRAVVTTPEAAVLRDSQGFSLVPAGVVNLTRSADDPEVWQGAFNGFNYQGDYTVNFLAADPDGFVTAAPPVELKVAEGPVVVAAPVPNLHNLENGNHLHVGLPAAGENQDTYLGIGLPDRSFYLLQDENRLMPFDGAGLISWQGGDTILDLPMAEWVPRGQYQLYLLRVPSGVEPLTNPEVWELGMSEFVAE